MKAAGIIAKDATGDRILKAGFHAVAEYDSFGQFVGSRGSLSSQIAWARVGQLALSGSGTAAAEKASAILLGGMMVAALGLEGGGVLLAVVEQPVFGAAADELARSLDAAVGEYIGPIPAQYAVLGGVALLALCFYYGGREA